MAKLKAINGGKEREKTFSLVCGFHLSAPEDISQVIGGEVVLRDGTHTQVPLQVLTGSRKQIRAQLITKIEAFFNRSGGDTATRSAADSLQSEDVSEAGC
jgi:hypothetical protein